VATIQEAMPLDHVCVPARILVLGGLLPEDAPLAVAKGFAVTCSNRELLQALQHAADPANPLPVHLKVDTGMSRLGCQPEEAGDFARAIANTPGLRLAGTYTHFASPDSDEQSTREQMQRFQQVLDGLDVEPGLRHACNSVAALRYPEMGLDAVRAGIAIYGCEEETLRPAMHLRCVITHVKTVRAGWNVGYGGTWKAEQPTRVATAALGYADGVHRARSNKGWTLVRGRRAPLIGRVSMDLITLDVSNIEDAAVGDTVTVMVSDGDEWIRPELVAEWSGSISYEMLTSVGARVVRRYLE
jgi:alanine racemase